MLLRCNGTLIHQQHLWQMRLQGGVVAYNTDVRERPTQLATRSLPCDACSGYLTFWTARVQAWLIPAPDAGLVQVQSQNRAARWYLAQQEMEPLPHSCCLDEQKMNKKRFRFSSPIANAKQSHSPQTGAALRPQKSNRRKPPSLKSDTLRTSLGLHRFRW